jgi:DNA-binding beta-propeller fold protein YncE
MKTKVFIGSLMILLLLAGLISAQTISPVITFKEDPLTHNMHICSDGQYYYTVNGGKPDMGQIGKFNLDGSFIKNIPIELDMRGIIYHKKDKCFYVNTYLGKIYKITEINSGIYTEVFDGLFPNDQNCIAADTKDKYFYCLNSGELLVYDKQTGAKVNVYKGLKCGEEMATGAASVAVDKKYIYTWNSDLGEIYVYNKKDMSLEKTVKPVKGNYGFSISAANGMIFISEDGNYEEGTWYGYKI